MQTTEKITLRVLHIEDDLHDAELILRRLRSEGIECSLDRVWSQASIQDALQQKSYDIILCDYTIPPYDGILALQDVRRQDPEIPFIFVSGTIGEIRAVEGLKLGATDYVLKNDLTRLVPSIRRSLREAEERRKRKAAEDALAEREAFLRSIIEAEPECVNLIDRDGRLLQMNKAGLAMIDADSEQQVVGRMITDLVTPDFHETIMTMVQRSFLGESASLQFEMIGIKGRRRWMDSIAVPFRSSNSQITASLTISRDITEKRRAEEAIRQSEERYRRLIEAMNEGMLQVDNDDVIQFANDQLCEMTGYSREELIGKVAYDILLLDEDKEFLLRKNALRTKDVADRYEVRIKKKSGEVRWFMVSGSPILDSTGKVIGSLGIHNDTTDRKRAEEELRLQTSYFRQLFDNSPAAIVIIDPNDHILDINKAFTKIFQYQLEEIKGCSLNDYIVPHDHIDEARELSMRPFRGEVVQTETVRKRKDGTLVEVDLTGYPIVVAGKRVGVYGIYVDITDHKKLEEQMRQAQKMESIGTLAAGIAHDFNNILAIILAYTTLLQRRELSDAQYGASLETISNTVQRGATLVRQILTFARRSGVSLEPVRINEVIRDLGTMLRQTFSRTIEISLDLEEQIPVINVDANQLHQAILNLCVNARDAILEAMSKGLESGKVVIRTRLLAAEMVRQRLSEAQNTDYVSIRVEDTGVGIDQATKQRLFEPFFTTKGQGKGTGLGLAVVYGVVQAHHGFVDVDSTVGRGTAFTMYFPASTSSAQASKPPIQGEAKGGTETILIVEDEEALLQLLKTFLRDKGYRILEAKNGEEAVDVYSKNHDHIALVLSDFGLPKLNGVDAFKRMKQINREVKTILASGFVEPSQRSEILLSGVKEIVPKPYVINEVLKKIREILDAP